MSRVTTINFLNKMTDEGYLTHTETTTKRGHKRIYRPSPTAPDEDAFRRVLAKRVMGRVLKEIATNRADEEEEEIKEKTRRYRTITLETRSDFSDTKKYLMPTYIFKLMNVQS